MQVGIGGAAGDQYDALRHFLPDPSLGPHDPITAVELAALVLIKDKGAPTGQPIDAYRDYARAYNGSGPDSRRLRSAGNRRRARVPGRRDDRGRSRLQRRVRRAVHPRGEGADPRRRGRCCARRCASSGAGDDCRWRPDQPLPLQLRRRARRPGPDDESVNRTRRRCRARRRTAARAMTAPRRPHTSYGAAGSAELARR